MISSNERPGTSGLKQWIAMLSIAELDAWVPCTSPSWLPLARYDGSSAAPLLRPAGVNDCCARSIRPVHLGHSAKLPCGVFGSQNDLVSADWSLKSWTPV